MKKIIYILGLAAFFSSCEGFLDRTPIDFPTEGTLYTDVKGLQGGVIGAYDGLQSTDQYGGKFMILMEKRGDNVEDNNPAADSGVNWEVASLTETASNQTLRAVWLSIYATVARCNLILQNTPEVTMSDQERNEIEGQAAFIRGLCYFNLVRLWGKVPLVLQAQEVDDARNNSRAEIADVYAQIVLDLERAKKLPSSWPDAEHGRATSFAAQALLAKVFLYQQDYGRVVSELSPIVAAIESGTEISLVPMNETFPDKLKTSRDVLFAVQFLKGGIGESALQNNRYRNNSGSSMITLPQSLFEAGDIRQAMVAPTGSGKRPGKFNAPATNNETSSDFPVMRCAEVMLMYAEALNEGVTTPPQGAFDALNAVRANAGLAGVTVADYPTTETFRDAVWQERRLELALECDRWFDIVRTGQFAAIYPLVESYRTVFPIPQAQIENVNDPSGWQNDGYR